MRAHRVLGDVQPGGDLIGTEVLVEEEENLDLAGGELLRNLVGNTTHPATLADAIEEPTRDRAGQGSLAVRNSAEEERDALRWLALQEVSGRSGPDRLEQILVRSRCGEHDDLALG